MSSDEVKSHVQARFNEYAQGYVTSATHSGGADLERLVEVVRPQPDWVALDVATGGGHTALRLAPHVARMVASDFGLTMLNAARAHIQERGAAMTFAGADAENLPFADAAFDLVTCRIAAHHFPDAYRFVQESARVLKPGGVLAVQDHVVPDDPRATAYIEAFERLHDPSHHRAFSESEWRGMLLDAGLTVEYTEKLSRPANMIAWAERQGNTPETIEHLRILLAQAPRAVAEWMNPRSVLSPDIGFDHVYILIVGRKPS